MRRKRGITVQVSLCLVYNKVHLLIVHLIVKEQFFSYVAILMFIIINIRYFQSLYLVKKKIIYIDKQYKY